MCIYVDNNTCVTTECYTMNLPQQITFMFKHIKHLNLHAHNTEHVLT